MKWNQYKYKSNSKRIIDKNYEYNKNCNPNGLIEKGQGTGEIKNLRLSRCKFENVGCEVIASYNMFYHYDISIPISKIAAECEMNALILPSGKFGCNPLKLKYLFRTYGLTLKSYYIYSKLKNNTDNIGSMVISYFTGKPLFSTIHTVFVIKSDNIFYVYNRYNNSTHKSKIESFDEIVKSRFHFICAYTKNKQTP